MLFFYKNYKQVPMFGIILSRGIPPVAFKFLKLECDSRAVIEMIGKPYSAGRCISHYDVHIHIRSGTKEYRSPWARKVQEEGRERIIYYAVSMSLTMTASSILVTWRLSSRPISTDHR